MMVVPEIMNPGRCVDECIPLDFIISAISVPVCWFSTVYTDLGFFEEFVAFDFWRFLSEATDSGFLKEFAAFDFLANFQRQLILDFLKNLLPLIFGEFFRGN